jgi:hypothetical protein
VKIWLTENTKSLAIARLFVGRGEKRRNKIVE